MIMKIACITGTGMAWFGSSIGGIGRRRLYFMALGVLLRLLLRGFLSFYTETRQKIGQANLVVGNLFLVAWP